MSRYAFKMGWKARECNMGPAVNPFPMDTAPWRMFQEGYWRAHTFHKRKVGH